MTKHQNWRTELFNQSRLGEARHYYSKRAKFGRWNGPLTWAMLVLLAALMALLAEKGIPLLLTP